MASLPSDVVEEITRLAAAAGDPAAGTRLIDRLDTVLWDAVADAERESRERD